MSQALEESIIFWQGTYSESDMIMQELKSMICRIRESNTEDIEVLRDFAGRSGLSDVEDFVDVYENCKGTGANLIQAINRAAVVIGDKITLEKELHMLMAQKRFESRVVMSSPFAVLMFLKIMSPEYLLPLTSTSQGMAVSTAALILIVTASFMMERVTRFEI
jgi:tight adherence protein B